MLRKITLYILVCLSFSALSQTNKEKQKTDSLFTLFNNGNQEKAYTGAKRYLKTTITSRSKANLNLLLGYYFYNKAQTDSSFYYTEQALKNKGVVGDSLSERLSILAYNLFALNNKIKGLYHESKKWHILGAERSLKHKEYNLYYSHLHGLASTYMGLNEPDEAIIAFKKCLRNPDPDEEILLGSYINLGTIYSSKKKFKLSNKYLYKAKKICRGDENRTHALANILLIIGDNLLNNGDNKKALDRYCEVKDICHKKEYKDLEITSLEKIAYILMNEERYDEADRIYHENLYKSTLLGKLRSQMISFQNLGKIYKHQKKFKKAYIYNNKYHLLKDSIARLQKKKEINILEIKFKTLEKEKAIKLLQLENIKKNLKLKNKDSEIKNFRLQKDIAQRENENRLLKLNNRDEKRRNEIALLKEKEEVKSTELKRQKNIQNIVLIAFFLILIPIIGLLVIYYQKLQAQSLLNIQEKEISKQKVNSLIKDQELKLIRASVAAKDLERKKIAQEMHDSIGGNLAAIKLQFSQLHENPEKIDLIYKQLDDTYEQVRDISHNLLPKKIIETKFVELIREHKQRITESTDIHINIDLFPEDSLNKLPKELQNDLYSVFQELCTNTIKHAKASVIELQLDLLHDSIFFVYEDNGVGFNVNKNNSGIGLTNIENRIKNFNGEFHIDSHPNRGTIFNLEIPIKKNEA